jgi:hypothetical protein
LTKLHRLLELDQLGLRSITKTDCADDDAKLAAALQPKPQVAPDDRSFRDAMTAVFAVDTLEGLENFLKVATQFHNDSLMKPLAPHDPLAGT